MGYNGAMNRKKQGWNTTKHILELGTFLGSLVLCRVRVGESCAPFGLAAMAAAELMNIDPLFAGAGVLIGAFLSGEPLWGVMIAAAAFVLLTRLMKIMLEEVSVSARMLVFLLCEIAVLPFEMVLTWRSCAYAMLSLAMSAVAVVLISRCLGLLRHGSRLCVLQEPEQLLLFGLWGLLLLGMGDFAAAGVSLPVVLLDAGVLLLVECKGPAGLGTGILPVALRGTLPLRVGVYSLCLLPLLIRGMRYLVRRGFEGGCVRRVRLEAGGSVRELTAFLDTGNLLTEPLSGLPVVLVGAGVPLPPGRPLLVEGRGAVEVSRGRVWPAAGGEAVPVYVGRAPMDLGEYEALLPGAAVHEGRKRDVQKAARAVLSALCPAVLQAVSVLSGAERGEPAPAAVAGGGEKLRPGGPNQRGGPEQAHRAQPQAGGVHRPEV